MAKSNTETAADPKDEPKPRCFVIMPISDHPEYSPGHFTRVYKELIEPAVEEAGFSCVRADDESETQVIILQILEKVTQFDMAICDLSSLNANVFYELGVRQMAKKPVTLIKDERTPRMFDVSLISDISYDSSLRVDYVRSARENIVRSLKATYESRDTNTNSLLDLLGVHVKVTEKEVPISSGENLILQRLNSLAIQINSGQTQIAEVSDPSSSFRPKDMNGMSIRVGDALLETASQSIFFVNGIRVEYEGAGDYVISLSTQDLANDSFTTRKYKKDILPFYILDANNIRLRDVTLHQKYLAMREVFRKSHKP